jgi:hypothetical protein
VKIYKPGNRVLVEGRQVTFVRYSYPMTRFQGEWRDPHTGETIKRWFDVKDIEEAGGESGEGKSPKPEPPAEVETVAQRVPARHEPQWFVRIISQATEQEIERWMNAPNAEIKLMWGHGECVGIVVAERRAAITAEVDAALSAKGDRDDPLLRRTVVGEKFYTPGAGGIDLDRMNADVARAFERGYRATSEATERDMSHIGFLTRLEGGGS